jgi:hypothetical protein
MTRKERIANVMANKSDLIEMKKASVKYADSQSVFLGCETSIGEGVGSIIKALQTSTENDTPEIIKRTVIGNTYNWLDSHGDVHLSSTFTKSLKERGEKVLHLHDHIYQTTAKVGKPTKVYEQEVKWSDLGIKKAGTTIALMMDSDIIKSYNPVIFDQYQNKMIDQHSVGMYYTKVDIAADDEDYPEAQKLWKQHIDKIGNKEEAEKIGYFYAVQEAKLVEISAVLEGSNTLTPTIDAKSVETEDLELKEKELKEKLKKDTLLKLINNK